MGREKAAPSWARPALRDSASTGRVTVPAQHGDREMLFAAWSSAGIRDSFPSNESLRDGMWWDLLCCLQRARIPQGKAQGCGIQGCGSISYQISLRKSRLAPVCFPGIGPLIPCRSSRVPHSLGSLHLPRAVKALLP